MTRKTKKQETTDRTVALCYIRQSLTRDKKDTDSPDRQRANIEAVCKRNGWTAEWHEDAEGHKSGTQEKNRPAWMALKSRLSDPDVVALVANDLSRLHRKGWRVGDLIDYLERRGVTMVLAAPNREIDLSTPMGRLFVQFSAIMDEWYAADISQRAKDSVAYRKAQGKSIGMPPFGTRRNKEGYLIPTTKGAWLLPDGSFVAGEADESPTDGAIWRGYYEAAKYVLTLYATGEYGVESISYQLNNEGWAFRDRKGNPRMAWRDDIRRVVANWPEYGGIVFDRKAKDRPAYEKYDVDEIPFRPDRAVFPLELVKAVARVRQQRTMKPLDRGVKRVTYPYPLSVITYCARCEQFASQQKNVKLRSQFSGRTEASGARRYRHKRGLNCGCINLSVPCEVLEREFSRLVKHLTVTPEAFGLMRELAIQLENGKRSDRSAKDMEVEKQEAIALCRRRIEATVILFGDGMIDKEEYRRRVEANEREIAHWEARTNQTEKLAYQLALCMEAVDKLSRLWDVVSDEDKQGLARSLFEYIVYDADTQRIVNFRLKHWADEFVVLRGKLYEDLMLSDKKEHSASIQGLRNDMPHTRFELVF